MQGLIIVLSTGVWTIPAAGWSRRRCLLPGRAARVGPTPALREAANDAAAVASPSHVPIQPQPGQGKLTVITLYDDAIYVKIIVKNTLKWMETGLMARVKSFFL